MVGGSHANRSRVLREGDSLIPRMCRRQRFRQWRRPPIGRLTVLALAAGISACSPRIDSHGNTVDPDRLAALTPGVHSRQDVEQLLGSPSSVSAFGRETWYYIGSRTETLAFLEPKVTERRVVAIRFGNTGTVETVDTFGLERGRAIAFVERETPTTGNEFTIWEQFIGNIGRFEGESQR